MENKKVDKTTLAFAFENPTFVAAWTGKPDHILDVRMTVDDLLAIVDLAKERREMQQKRGININRTNDGVHVRCKRCNSSIVLFNGLKVSEEVVENFKKMRIAVYGGHFCKYCGNDLRGKVHRT